MRAKWLVGTPYLGWALAALVILWLSATVIDFAWRLQPSRDDSAFPSEAVVFTGQFDRIRKGLDLLRQGRIQRLLISGVNPEAGIVAERFAEQFALDGTMRKALASGRLVLGTRAQTTLENATETACWVSAAEEGGSLLLITSRYHMPRASLVLEGALPLTTIRRLSTPERDNYPSIQPIFREFVKFAAMSLLRRIEHRAFRGKRCSAAG